MAILASLKEEEPLSAQKGLAIPSSSAPFHSSKGSVNWVPGEAAARQVAHESRLRQEGAPDGPATQAHMRMESQQSLQNEHDATIKNTDQQIEENRFKQSEMKMMSAEHNSQQLRHEIASETELNMFVPEKVMAGFYDLSDSVDNSQKNSFAHIRKSPADPEARSNQVVRT